MMCLLFVVSLHKGRIYFLRELWIVVVFKVVIICSELNKIAKDFSLVTYGFKIEGRLKS